jgi:hypothetical protein
MNRDYRVILNPRDRRFEIIDLLDDVVRRLHTNLRYTTIFNAMVEAQIIRQNRNVDNNDILQIKRVIASNVCYLDTISNQTIISDEEIVTEANQQIIYLETERVIARGERRTEIEQYIANFNILIADFSNNLYDNMQRGGRKNKSIRKNKSRRKNKKSRKSRKSRKQ